MTFKLNQNSVSRRRYGSSTSFSVSSGGPSVQGPWTNTGAGGALVFYASTDSYVTYANNGQFDLGTGDFTIEWWQYETDTNGAPRPWSFGQYPNAQMGISFEGSAVVWGGGGVLTTFNLSQPVQNTRNHFAWVRSQGFTTLWQNGQQLGSVEDTNYYNPSSDLTIGSEGAQDTISCFGGTITNFNMVNYAKYTQPFTPTNTALSVDPNARIFVPSTTLAGWVTPKGSYTGSVSPSSNMTWNSVSPFKFPAPLPTISGGVTSTDGTFYYTAFKSSGTFSVANSDLSGAEVLVIGGGGGGANGYAGGGGSGGLLHFMNVDIASGNWNVVVGAGGSSYLNGGYGAGYNGNSSTFAALSGAEAYGGGYGAVFSNGAGNGASGGGNGWWGGPGGYSIYPGQGHDGAFYVSQGGGGGGYVTAGSGWEGGQGTADFDAWGVATNSGKVSTGGLRYFAAGGNSETSSNTDYGRTPGWTSAEPNTGCGGAGNGISAASGGSGIVIIKYPVSSVAAVN